MRTLGALQRREPRGLLEGRGHAHHTGRPAGSTARPRERGERGRVSMMWLPVLAAAGSIALSGCAAMRMQMRYGTLQSDTKVSDAVFLDLRSDLPATVYIDETCSADSTITVRPSLDQQLVASGYTTVEDPKAATYIVQISHLQLIEVELSEDQTLGDALASALTAGFAAGLAADVVGASTGAATGVGLAVGAVGFIMDARTKHIAHILTTDVLVTETVTAGGGITEARAEDQEAAGGASQERRHETQIASGASKVNLRLTESLPAIVDGTSRTVSRLLPKRPAALP